MSLDGTAIQKIVDLANVELVEVDGVHFAPRAMHLVATPLHGPTQLHTLQGVVDAIGAKFTRDLSKEEESGQIGPPAIQVVNHETVLVVHPCPDLYGREIVDIRSRLGDTKSKFEFGRYYDTETFIIQLQTSFVEDETRTKLVQLASHMSKSDDVELRDDGISQQVAVKTGVHVLNKVDVPNPVTLRPYRTFLEVEQPASAFVFRVKGTSGAPQCALFEADGGKWRLDAIANIAKWLKEKLPDWAVIA